MNIKRYKQIKSIKEKLISGWYFCMKPLAYILVKYDNWYYKHKKKVLSNWTDKYVIKRYTKIFIKKLINSRYKEECFEIADYISYDDDDEQTILDAIKNVHRDKLSDWCYYTNYKNSVDRIEQLTNLFKQELEKYSEIECTYFNRRDKNKYCSLPSGYKKTLKVIFKNK